VLTLRAFIRANRAMARFIERRLPQAKANWWLAYERAVHGEIARRPGEVILDVGGGRHGPFVQPSSGPSARVVAVDVELRELRHNTVAQMKVVADVTAGLPFRDESIGMIVSRTVLEHLKDVEAFVVEARRVIRGDGCFIHAFPSRFAPFAIVNRLLPPAFSRKALFALRPECKGIGGFQVFYDRCYYSALKSLLQRHQCRIVEAQATYYQADYFDFFFPAFLLNAVYELLPYMLGLKNLAAFLVVVAGPTARGPAR
jgi:ubiquinone/menaquinone biosynthesis C-methylase UbiE